MEHISGMDYRFEIPDSTSSRSSEERERLLHDWHYQPHSPHSDDQQAENLPWLEWYNTSLRQTSENEIFIRQFIFSN